MNANLILAKELLSPPGDTIQETIDMMGMRQNELAERMGKTESKINDIIKGKEPITVNTALQLELVLGIPAKFWLAREANFREELARIEQQEAQELMIDWIKKFPLAQLKKLGYLSKNKTIKELVPELLKFFGIATQKGWEKIYLNDKMSVAFRVSLASTADPYAISSWLRMGELQSRNLSCAEFNASKFKACLPQIREIAIKQPEDFLQELKSICANNGVACVFTSCLPKAPISGATRWFSNKPLIQLSDRYKTNDHFWFAFFHEVAHVLLHPKKDIFLENLKGAEIDRQKEKEADAFASDLLIPDKYLKNIKGKITKEEILDIAHKANIHPSFVVGRLQHNEMLHFSRFNEMKIPISINQI